MKEASQLFWLAMDGTDYRNGSMRPFRLDMRKNFVTMSLLNCQSSFILHPKTLVEPQPHARLCAGHWRSLQAREGGSVFL